MSFLVVQYAVLWPFVRPPVQSDFMLCNFLDAGNTGTWHLHTGDCMPGRIRSSGMAAGNATQPQYERSDHLARRAHDSAISLSWLMALKSLFTTI
jgi:hypothetical protein